MITGAPALTEGNFSLQSFNLPQILRTTRSYGRKVGEFEIEHVRDLTTGRRVLISLEDCQAEIIFYE